MVSLAGIGNWIGNHRILAGSLASILGVSFAAGLYSFLASDDNIAIKIPSEKESEIYNGVYREGPRMSNWAFHRKSNVMDFDFSGRQFLFFDSEGRSDIREQPFNGNLKLERVIILDNKGNFLNEYLRDDPLAKDRFVDFDRTYNEIRAELHTDYNKYHLVPIPDFKSIPKNPRIKIGKGKL